MKIPLDIRQLETLKIVVLKKLEANKKKIKKINKIKWKRGKKKQNKHKKLHYCRGKYMFVLLDNLKLLFPLKGTEVSYMLCDKQ